MCLRAGSPGRCGAIDRLRLYRVDREESGEALGGRGGRGCSERDTGGGFSAEHLVRVLPVVRPSNGDQDGTGVQGSHGRGVDHRVHGKGCDRRGSEFLTGQRYVIYGDRDPEFGIRHLSSDKPLYGRGVYWTNDSMRTRLFDVAEVAEMEALRKGREHR